MDSYTPNHDMWSEEPDAQVERILKAKRRKELEERYGGDFSAAAEMQREAENTDALIRHLEEWEDNLEKARRIPIRQFLGYPRFRPLSEIAPDELADETNNVLDYLALQQIYVETLCDVPDDELYRFLTEELLDEEIEDVRTPVMNTHFIYEEFHPNDEYDVKMWAEDFVRMILIREIEFLPSHLSPDELYNAKGLLATKEEIVSQIRAFLARNPVIVNVHVKPVKWQVEGDYATVWLATAWESFKADQGETVQITGHSQVRLKRSPDIGWDVIQAQIAGWHEIG